MDILDHKSAQNDLSYSRVQYICKSMTLKLSQSKHCAFTHQCIQLSFTKIVSEKLAVTTANDFHEKFCILAM